jgi:tRNA (guanine9-N1)-methyltransferase
MSTDQLPAASPVPDATPAEIINSSEAAPTLSKSAQKRQARNERFAQLKLERRAREKEEKVAKRKERDERAAAGEDVGPSKKRRVTRGGEGPVQPFDARIAIDLGFDEKMTEKVRRHILYPLCSTDNCIRKLQAYVASLRTHMRPIDEPGHHLQDYYSLLSMGVR